MKYISISNYTTNKPLANNQPHLQLKYHSQAQAQSQQSLKTINKQQNYNLAKQYKNNEGIIIPEMMSINNQWNKENQACEVNETNQIDYRGSVGYKKSTPSTSFVDNENLPLNSNKYKAIQHQTNGSSKNDQTTNNQQQQQYNPQIKTITIKLNEENTTKLNRQENIIKQLSRKPSIEYNKADSLYIEDVLNHRKKSCTIIEKPRESYNSKVQDENYIPSKKNSYQGQYIDQINGQQPSTAIGEEENNDYRLSLSTQRKSYSANVSPFRGSHISNGKLDISKHSRRNSNTKIFDSLAKKSTNQVGGGGGSISKICESHHRMNQGSSSPLKQNKSCSRIMNLDLSSKIQKENNDISQGEFYHYAKGRNENELRIQDNANIKANSHRESSMINKRTGFNSNNPIYKILSSPKLIQKLDNIFDKRKNSLSQTKVNDHNSVTNNTKIEQVTSSRCYNSNNNTGYDSVQPQIKTQRSMKDRHVNIANQFANNIYGGSNASGSSTNIRQNTATAAITNNTNAISMNPKHPKLTINLDSLKNKEPYEPNTKCWFSNRVFMNNNNNHHHQKEKEDNLHKTLLKTNPPSPEANEFHRKRSDAFLKNDYYCNKLQKSKKTQIELNESDLAIENILSKLNNNKNIDIDINENIHTDAIISQRRKSIYEKDDDYLKIQTEHKLHEKKGPSNSNGIIPPSIPSSKLIPSSSRDYSPLNSGSGNGNGSGCFIDSNSHIPLKYLLGSRGYSQCDIEHGNVNGIYEQGAQYPKYHNNPESMIYKPTKVNISNNKMQLQQQQGQSGILGKKDMVNIKTEQKLIDQTLKDITGSYYNKENMILNQYINNNGDKGLLDQVNNLKSQNQFKKKINNYCIGEENIIKNPSNVKYTNPGVIDKARFNSNGITIEKSSQLGSKNQMIDDKAKSGKPNHKKTKSESLANPFDNLWAAINLPVNLDQITSSRNVATPDSSKIINTSFSIFFDNPDLTDPSSQSTSNPYQTFNTGFLSDDKKDDSALREKLISLIKRSFEQQNYPPATTLDFYRLIKMIGKGAFGKVYLGIQLLTGKYVAIKSIDKEYIKDEFSRRKVLQEVLILQKTCHKNIIKLLEVFENKNYLFMVFENAARGDLLNYVKSKCSLKEDEAKKLFIQIVEGVKYCHGQNILHRDIKLDNILLDNKNVVKICDFGVSRFIKKGHIITEQCGTPAYIAPEIILDKGYEGCYADLWSMGVLLYAMVTGTVPFKANDMEELQNAIINGIFTIPSYLSDSCRDLISSFLKLNPYSRININEVMKHRWFSDIIDNNKYMMMMNPSQNTLMTSGGTSSTINSGGALSDHGKNLELIETIIEKVESYGFPREYIIKSLNQKNCTHAFATYYLLYKELMENSRNLA